MLNVIGKYCNEHNIKYKPIMSLAPKAGEEIVSQCKNENIDFVVVGRRGGPNKIFGSASVSQYLVENSPCSVLVAKGSPC